MDHHNETGLPGLSYSAAEVANSTRKVRCIVEGYGATLVTGHDPEGWPDFKMPPGYYS
jgi:hypothetical protein